MYFAYFHNSEQLWMMHKVQHDFKGGFGRNLWVTKVWIISFVVGQASVLHPWLTFQYGRLGGLAASVFARTFTVAAFEIRAFTQLWLLSKCSPLEVICTKHWTLFLKYYSNHLWYELIIYMYYDVRVCKNNQKILYILEKSYSIHLLVLKLFFANFWINMKFIWKCFAILFNICINIQNA